MSNDTSCFRRDKGTPFLLYENDEAQEHPIFSHRYRKLPLNYPLNSIY